MRLPNSHTHVLYHQALRCVAFRLPLDVPMSSAMVEGVLGLRYGLIGATAVFPMLQEGFDRQGDVPTYLATEFPAAVERHLLQEVDANLRKRGILVSSERIRDMVAFCMNVFLNAVERKMSLPNALAETADAFAEHYNRTIARGVPLWQRPGLKQKLDDQAKHTLRFCGNFFQRRLHDLEEVPEIALLGE
jgi:hypothetical protein